MTPLNRRTLLRAGLATGAGLAGGALLGGARASARTAAPAWLPGDRPSLTHGIQSGDATADSAVVWSRADRASRMCVEVSTRPDFRGARRFRGPVLAEESGFTGKVRLRGLPAGRQLHYRVRAESLDRHGRYSEPLVGSLRTAPGPGQRPDIRFVWTADVAGQGWGINPDFGGMKIFKQMAAAHPDFYLCSGDHIYADGPISETVTLPDGQVWRNLVTPEKSKVAETLDDFRGQHAYNMLDENLRAFLAQVPQISQWDDHEVHNNWYPGQLLDDDRFTEKRIDVLAARSKQAFHEWLPTSYDGPQGRIYRKLSYGPLLDVFVLDMRTYKDPNDADTYTDPTRGMLGAEQRAWLIRELTRSRATWKVIANDLPLGLVVSGGAGTQEAVAQGDPGAPAGRELEFAEVLRAAHRAGTDGIVFLTADVHYSAAHHYDPARAAVQDFAPFWEFVSGPAHAGGFKQAKLDGTFGPEVVFVHAPPAAYWSPADGYQHFGDIAIDGESGAMTVHLRDQDGVSLWSTTLPAPR